MAYAYCWRSGQIDIGPDVPEGTLPLGRGRKRDLSRALERNARLSYDNLTWLVPGLPEAKSEDEAYDAFRAFRGRIEQDLSAAKVKGVV